MLVAVTGAGGLLGRAVSAELRSKGYTIRQLDRHVPSGETWHPTDLCDRAATDAALSDVDAVVHLAAWPNPFVAKPRDGWNDNTTMASNVLFSTMEHGVGRVVYASSQTVLGLAWADGVIPPDYVPVDEEHPCRPRDWYGASKLAGEHLLASQSRSGPLSGFALRFPAIWQAAEFETAKQRRLADPEQAARSQWAYVDARDAARAVRLSVEADATGFQLLNIGAPNIFSSDRVHDLIASWYPNVDAPEYIEAVFDARRAEKVLGFRGRYIWGLSGITISD